MKGFNFEKNLNHQSHTVESTIAVFENINLVQPTEFDFYPMSQAFDKYSIEYKKVSNSIHPAKLTYENGFVLNYISASDVGVFVMHQLNRNILRFCLTFPLFIQFSVEIFKKLQELNYNLNSLMITFLVIIISNYKIFFILRKQYSMLSRISYDQKRRTFQPRFCNL